MTRPPPPAELRPVADFCNSAKHLYGQDQFAAIVPARRWLADHGHAEADAVTETDLVTLRWAREVIRSFLVDRDAAGPREDVNQLVQRVIGPPMLDTAGGLTFTHSGNDTAAAVLHPVVVALLTKTLTGEGDRLKVCAAPECRWVYFDRSPAAAGLWCDMNICGTRHKMRAYRARGATRDG